MFVIFNNISNIFQTSFLRFQDVWLANFNDQLATCYKPVKQEVVVSPGADQQLLHGDVLASLPGLGGCEAALAVQDVVAFQHTLVREELSCLRMLREVGSIVVNEPAVSDLPLGVVSHDAALMVQDEDVHLDPARDEVPRYVGSTILNDTSFNSDAMAQNQVLF